MNVKNLHIAINKHLNNLCVKNIKTTDGFNVIDLTNQSHRYKTYIIELFLVKGQKIKTGIFNNKNILLVK